jgi:hypothetical protein
MPYLSQLVSVAPGTHGSFVRRKRFGTLRSSPASTTCSRLQLAYSRTQFIWRISEHAASRHTGSLCQVHRLDAPISFENTAHRQGLFLYTLGVCMSVMKQWLLSEPCRLTSSCRGRSARLPADTPGADYHADPTKTIAISQAAESNKAMDVNTHGVYPFSIPFVCKNLALPLHSSQPTPVILSSTVFPCRPILHGTLLLPFLQIAIPPAAD